MSDLAARLAPHYSAFKVHERLLLTGHSHQAWPDVAKLGLDQCFADAAEHVDDKWGAAFAQADLVRAGYRRLLHDPRAQLALFANTFEAIVTWLSAQGLTQRPHLVTTDGEFHSLRRLLARLEEEGVRVDRIAAKPVDTLAERYAAHVRKLRERPCAAFCSSVLFETAEVVPDLRTLADACRREGVALMLDTYHHLNAAPFDPAGLEDVSLVGGGYKYCQLGEGNAFLRVPERTTWRPIATGWFAEFRWLDAPPNGGPVPYGDGADRFLGATYDPSSHYRGARVFDFFRQHGLDAATLHSNLQRQLTRLVTRFDRASLPTTVVAKAEDYDVTTRAGFLALRSPFASELVKALHVRGVLADARGEWLRLGPAPYLSDAQLDASIDALAEVASKTYPTV